jgi:hypothetical protein
MSDKTSPKYLTLREFVEHSRLSESTVRRRARDGKGKRLLFPVDALTQTNPEPVSMIGNNVEHSPTIPSPTETPANTPSGPRPRWMRSGLPRPR